MAEKYYYWYKFLDGSSFISLRLTETELGVESKKRGRCVAMHLVQKG